MSQPGSAADRAARAVLQAIREVNQARAKDRQIPAALETPLLGEGAAIDSLGLVNLIVAVEEQVTEEFGVTINVADEKARAQPDSPFKTVGTLAAYVASLVGAAS